MVLLAGFSDEDHQSMVPGRSPSLVDVGIDLLAAVLVVNREILLEKGRALLKRGEKQA